MASTCSRRDCLRAGIAGMGLTFIPKGLARAYQANEKPSIAVIGSGIGLKNTRECRNRRAGTANW